MGLAKLSAHIEWDFYFKRSAFYRWVGSIGPASPKFNIDSCDEIHDDNYNSEMGYNL